jgi:3-isopropylmalate/(R)-2-methylmalate dehydratase small subunit
MKVKGNVIKYGDNVDTDVIIPARYLNTANAKELAAHCMEDLDETFVSRVKKGDIMAGGANFGCGSSREHAPLAIKESGIAAVVAKSFARIFYRNAINIGLPIVECGCAIDEGDTIEIDFDNGKLTNLTKGTVDAFPPFPAFLQNIIAAGGLMKSIDCK